MSARADLDEIVGLLASAARVARRIQTQAPDDGGSLAYEAMMWADYLETFRREASAQRRGMRP